MKNNCYSMPTNTSISDAMGVISPDFCRQHEDASLLLLAHGEIFLAGFVCLVVQSPEVSQSRSPSSSFIAFFFFYSTSWLLCKSPHPGAKKSPSLEHRHLPHASLTTILEFFSLVFLHSHTDPQKY